VSNAARTMLRDEIRLSPRLVEVVWTWRTSRAVISPITMVDRPVQTLGAGHGYERRPLAARLFLGRLPKTCRADARPPHPPHQRSSWPSIVSR